jgi:hypothetical protein
MATYTVTQLKDLTSIPKVSIFSDAKILMYQTIAERWLEGLNIDTSVQGYSTDTYNAAVLLLFDYIAENPTGLQSESQGRVSKTYSREDLPAPVANLLAPYIGGEKGGVIAGAPFVRNDIGLR